MRVGVVTISDSRAANVNELEDISGDLLQNLLSESVKLSSVEVARRLIPDNFDGIVEVLKTLVPTCDVILTSGGIF